MNYDISMVIGGMPFGPDTLKTKSLGGSESAALYMANELARLGNRVTIFNNRETSDIDPETRVNYMPIGAWSSHGRNIPHDICIIQRAPEAFSQRINSRLNYLWCHDLPDPGSLEQFRGVAWNIDKVMLLSDFMVQEYKKAWKLQDSEIFQTRNGVDLNLISGLGNDTLQRDRKKIIYSARPERGLDLLLSRIFPRLIERDPDIKLYISTYDNKVEHWQDFYAFCDSMAEKYGDSIVQLGPLTKEELYRHYLTAGVYVYPTPSPVMPKFREISCISAMECMACGLPFVSSDQGALPETLADKAGILIKGENTGTDYIDTFVNAVIQYTCDDVAFNRASKAGMEAAEDLAWSKVAESWVSQFDSNIAANNNDPYRLAKHFWRMSDIVAADRLIGDLSKTDITPQQWKAEGKNKYGQCKILARDIDWDFGFYRTDEGMREQYEKIGSTHDAAVIDWSPREPRYAELKRWLLEHTEIESILDYGCAHGGYCTNLAKEVGRQWTGIDIDHHGIDLLNQFAEKLGVADKVTGIAWDIMNENFDSSDIISYDNDMVMMQEVLEHVREPWTVAERVEKFCKKGGKVYITVPFGPWEYESYFTYPYRAHIWHFDLHDIHDMFGDKKSLEVNTLLAGRSELLGDPIGWWIITYDADHEPVGRIDMERKLKLQRPRQTVSAILMGGPGAEEQMHWTLRCLRDIADEIILVDTGMNDEAKHIAVQYPVRIIPGVDPKAYGFEQPRNMGLDEAVMDWVLWIDLDERIPDTVPVHKYLRENGYNGYGIHQHHFAVDTTFKPDMPVRLFRNRPKDGKNMRFFGMIHEHPEFELNEGPGTVIVLADVHIAHSGYLSENIRQARFIRNLPMLERDIEKYPNRILQKHFIMRDNILLCRHELKSNGMRVTPGIQQRCQEVIRLGKEYFIGKDNVMSSDSLEYYSEALGILGRGFEIAVSLSANRERAKPNGTKYLRFESKEDYMTWMTAHAEASVEPITRSLQ